MLETKIFILFYSPRAVCSMLCYCLNPIAYICTISSSICSNNCTLEFVITLNTQCSERKPRACWLLLVHIFFLNIFIFSYLFFCPYLNPWLITSTNLCQNPLSLWPQWSSCTSLAVYQVILTQLERWELILISVCQCHIRSVSQQAFFVLLVISPLLCPVIFKHVCSL